MMTTTTLEVMLAVTALLCAVVSGFSLGGSMWRRRVFQSDGTNGLRMLHATANVIRDAIRILSATVLASSAGVLIGLPPDTDPVALVAKGTLIVIGWCLLANALVDAVMRRRIVVAIEQQEGGR
jgi:hypothetical protein